ncbi:lipopolysaccharide biosynthesis protein [Methylotuvimicrobium alcaliphilum]|uniref:Polysaccharide biosynthesis protein n=1 Tax=Methylotuvimicrobium alcaliphilum (strain DSM 19304 / NCIMB 14124 / VKM B-2133 / 20Z) TaxID=1091494 RepID=G4SYT6_META2|nr:lipopolysaccharide biosynthesis protein [Methylotuvimicrobium alcaliphilum]CCE24383.1 conserved membrane protein of unknown function [Methylotuvimicrobium alcaliphilum 20Z]
MASIRKSLAISVLNKYIQITLQLVSYFVLARLLTPNEIGLFSVASSAIGIAQVFREFGVSSYLIQEKELTENKIATAFTITVIAGSLLFCLLFLLTPWLASFYNDERLILVFHLLSINFLIIPLNSTSLALLRREMRFGALFWISILASLTSFTVAVSLSSLGYGYMSLVWSSLANGLVSSLSVSFFLRGGMFHRLTLCEWRTVLSFGSQMTIISITGHISSNANDLITGKLLGFTATGIISRAQGVMYLFHRDITATLREVAFPAFANSHREQRDIEADYIKAVTILTVFAWPFYGFFSLFPTEALRLLFGPQWDAAAPLVPWFCAGGAVAATCSLIPTLLPALGGVRYLVRLHVLIDPLRIVTFAMTIYFFRTMEAFAIVFVIFFTISMPLLYYFKNKLLPTRYKLLTVGLLKSVGVSLCALAMPASLASIPYLDVDNTLLSELYLHYASWLYKTPDAPYLKDWLLIPLGLLMLPCWILGLILFRHPLADEHWFQKIVYYRIGGRREPVTEQKLS